MILRVRELRKQKNISQVALAMKVGCSQNMISKIEKGDADPRCSLLMAIADFFGVSVEYLLGISDNRGSVEEEQPNEQMSEETEEYMEQFLRLSGGSREAVKLLLKRMNELEENK